MSSLFPPGIDSLHDCPAPLFDAIRLASFFLGFDEMATEDRPPKEIWLDAERLNAHLSEVSRKHGGGAASDGSDQVLRNEAAKDLIVD